MRGYDDDNIRLYTPILQRSIILVAVIIAVPVVMWTITAFVRNYVAPPKVPTFQPMSQSAPQPSDNSAGQQPAATPSDTSTSANPPQPADNSAAAPQVTAAQPAAPGMPAAPVSAQPTTASMAAPAAPAAPASAGPVG